MRRHWLTTLGLLFGLQTGLVQARTLDVELQIQHIGGVLSASELAAMLASPRLSVTATFEPRWLIPGVTARLERIMPIGSRLFPILHHLELTGTVLERGPRQLHFRIAQVPEGHRSYRLSELRVALPLQPEGTSPNFFDFALAHLPEPGQALQLGMLSSQHSLELGMRLRYRWSDGPAQLTPLVQQCDRHVQAIDAERYRFRARHPLANLFRELASDVQSDPPRQPPAGQRSYQLHTALPDFLQGWQLQRQHLLQLQRGAHQLERLTLVAERGANSSCQERLSYEALFVDSQLVELEASLSCHAAGPSHWLSASWLEDGSLATLASGEGDQPSRSWDAFVASQPGCHSDDPGPSLPSLHQHQQRLQQLRQAFLQQPLP